MHLVLVPLLVLLFSLGPVKAAATTFPFQDENSNGDVIFLSSFEDSEIGSDPDPGDETNSNDLRGGLDFLVTGSDPNQPGFDPTSIDAAHTAALRGRTLLPGAAPLGGVEIAIADRPEWGFTTSADDGTWTMLVGGGETLVVEFRLDSHVVVQRTVRAAWNDWRVVEDVVLTPLDSAVTTIDLSVNLDQAHTSSTTIDGDGGRAASLLFRAGTAATMTLPDGITQPLDTLDVRATEVTVGETGPEAMPGELPLGSLYTYAVDVTVDQAEALGATRIDFDQPVTLWVDNFLGFPAGTPAPVGYYDRELASWIALDVQGIVADVVTVDAGTAALDLDGDGDSDGTDQAIADAEGIDLAERQSIGSRHAPGDSIIRVLVDHFTPFDLNWLPDEEVDTGDESDPKDDERQDEETCEGGASSVIACNNGTLLEYLEVPGAAGPLVYDSQRAAGRLANRTVRIPVTGTVVPPSLQEVVVQVDVAGQRIEERFDTPSPDTETTITWDGRDAFGRDVIGAVAVTVTHTELHAQSYASGGFGAPPTSGSLPAPVATREPTPISTVWRGTLVARQRPDGETIGGWTIPRHHRYDPVSGALHRGDGTDRTTRSVDRHAALWRLTGADTLGVGAPSLQTSPDATGVAVRGDGSIVVAAASERLVYLITRDGLLESFAGTGASGDAGDGGDPAAATFIEPLAVTVLADGSVLVVDAGAGRVRRIDATIEPFAGAATGGSTDPGVAAVDYDLVRPISAAAQPDGGVLIADAGAGLILRVGADGRIAAYAGGGAQQSCTSGCFRDELDLTGLTDIAVSADGNQIAIAANGNLQRLGVGGQVTTQNVGLPVGQVAFAPDGGLWIGSELGTGLLRKDGTLAVPNFDVQATGTTTGTLGGSTSGSAIDARDLTVTSQGDVVLADGITGYICQSCRGDAGPPATGVDGVFVITSPLRSWRIAGLAPFGLQVRPGSFTNGAAYVLPSRDGGELYLFDAGGRHLRTVRSDLLVLTDAFGYDADGRLVSHTDANGRITIIERDATGSVTSIVGPEGRQTTLLQTDDLITGATDPLGRIRTFAYEDGLLVGHTDLAGNPATYQYLDGQLERAVATDGTVFTLAETEDEDGHTIAVTTGGLETRVTKTTIDDLAISSVTMQTYADGSSRMVQTSADGSMNVIERNGAATFTDMADDPRFGALVQYTSSSFSTVGDSFVGDFLSTWIRLEVSQTDPADPFSVTQVLRRVTLDEFGLAGEWAIDIDPIARTITNSDPVGISTIETYDAAGRVTSRDRPTGLADTTISYDASGRPTSQVTGSQQVDLSYDSDGDLVRIELADGTARDHDHDAAGRLTETTIDGDTAHYSHDTLEVLTGWTTPSGVTHSATVTPARNLSARLGPPSPIAQRNYDAARRPAEIIHGDGTTTAITYEGGKVSTIDGPEVDVTIDYETVFPAGTTTPTVERVVRTLAPASEISVMTVERDLDVRSSLPVSVEASYDRSGDGLARRSHYSNQRWSGLLVNRREVDFDVASRIQMEYDAARRQIREGPWNIDRSGTAGTAASYSADLPGGTVTQTTTLDEHGMIIGRNLAVDGLSVATLELLANAAGRVTAQRIVIDGIVKADERYQHNAKGFLVEVSDVGGVVLAGNGYDIDGNRTTYTVGGVTTNSSFDADGLIIEYDGNPITMDANGMVASMHGWSLDHAVTGELLVATDGTVTIWYGYDDVGRRVARQAGDDITMYLYGDMEDPGRVTDVVAPDGTLTQYLYDDAGHIYAIRRDGVWYGVLSDAVGSPIAVVDDNGTIVDSRRFNRWGNLLSDTNPSFELEIGFAGGLHDADTGLVRFGQREYDPLTARWLSPDPLHLMGGSINLYRYATNDPVSFRDTTGLFTAGGAAVFGGGAAFEITVDDSGWSACSRFGAGFDVGPIIDLTGEHQDPGRIQESSFSLGPVDVTTPLKPGGADECEFDVPFTSDPFAANDFLDLLEDLAEDGVKGFVKGVRGIAGSIHMQQCSGVYAW